MAVLLPAATAATASRPDSVLTVEHLRMRFGGLVAIDDLSFSCRRGDITALIGPNGAGKTTVFNCITGFYKPSEGMVTLRHADGASFLLERLPGHAISWRAKVARTFQNIRLFSGMTVLENLMVGPRRGPTTLPETCPTARRGGSRSRAPCARIRSCSASMSRPPASTRARASSSTSC